jgi:hypothetical protein
MLTRRSWSSNRVSWPKLNAKKEASHGCHRSGHEVRRANHELDVRHAARHRGQSRRTMRVVGCRNVGDPQARTAWREAFGRFTWDNLRGDRATMFVFGDDTTDATNAFNQALMNRVRLATFAYLVKSPADQGGTFWLISGLVDANRQPQSLPSWNRLPELLLPYFVERQPFRRRLQKFQANAWVDDWCTDFNALLNEATGGPWLISPPFEMAVLSMWDASINGAVDFRIPALVRTIECLIAIPRGQGAPDLRAARSVVCARRPGTSELRRHRSHSRPTTSRSVSTALRCRAWQVAASRYAERRSRGRGRVVRLCVGDDRAWRDQMGPPQSHSVRDVPDASRP